LATLVSALLSSLTRLRSVKFKQIEIDLEKAVSESAPLESLIEKRIDEAREILQSQEGYEKRNRWSAGSLSFGQYVIGGILATSFVQESLSPQIVGFLGVLVLVSSLINQRFRPDLKATGARIRVAKLRAVVRKAETDLAALRSEHQEAPSLYSISEHILNGLAEVDQLEQQELMERLQTTVTGSNRGSS
jgi:hypothetical protein